MVLEECAPYEGKDDVCHTRTQCGRHYTAYYRYVGGEELREEIVYYYITVLLYIFFFSPFCSNISSSKLSPVLFIFSRKITFNEYDHYDASLARHPNYLNPGEI